MKTNRSLLGRHLSGLAAGLCLAAASTALAQFASPVGTWDFVINGKANGVAFITFESDYSLSGIEIIAPKGQSSPDPVSGSRYIVEPGRYPDTSTSTNNLSSTNVLYGTYTLKGWWTFDSTGKIVGNFPEIGYRSDGTTVSGVTNSVQFTAKVKPGKKLTLLGSSGIGKVNYLGVPLTSSTDLSGSWVGETKRGGQNFYESMDVFPYDAFSFAVLGTGATYDFAGRALVSQQKKLALHTYWTTSTESVVRVVVGSYNSGKSIGSLKGIEDPNFSVKLKMSRTAAPIND